MVTDQQRMVRSSKWRRKFLHWLIFLSCCFHLTALICIIILVSAGCPNTVMGYDASPLGMEFALVQFSTHITISSPMTLYWFLDAFGWSGVIDSAHPTAGSIYVGVGRTLRFPNIIHTFGNATFFNPDSQFDNKTILGFATAPTYAVSTAPAFTLYMLVAISIALLLPFHLLRNMASRTTRTNKTDCTTTLLTSKYSLLAVYAIIPMMHMIATIYIMERARQVLSYLQNIPDIVWNISMGSGFLKLIWLGFLSTALGSLICYLHWWLKQRWNEMLKWENVLNVELANV
ncbi:hypothetical protein BGZ63DRAFT_373136 [Mariannaea sp. PMI_226]|nr:hypothetical protein BGZ63DRAFT_373136 [Mariannaea sp. PMI_226]